MVRVYRTACLKCHDTDGKGEIIRDVTPKVPDFTDAAWQASRADADLAHSILEGKGKSMPPMRKKLGAVDVGQMVAFVRAFRGGQQVVDDVAETAAAPQPSEPPRPSPEEERLREGSRLFQRSCARCHGSGGRGDEMRDTSPGIPDFTAAAWQRSRTDPQLVASVLDGKGTGMPSFRDKLPREQARELVAFIRSLDPSRSRATPTPADDFDARFQQLLAEFEDLRRRSRALSDDATPAQGRGTPGPATPPPSAAGPPK